MPPIKKFYISYREETYEREREREREKKKEKERKESMSNEFEPGIGM
jgi:hypothetical protein